MNNNNNNNNLDLAALVLKILSVSPTTTTTTTTTQKQTLYSAPASLLIDSPFVVDAMINFTRILFILQLNTSL